MNARLAVFGRHRTGSVYREIAVVVVVAIGLSLLLKTFFVQAFFIPSESMENTLQRGDRIVVNKLVSGDELQRGDVVVFQDPDDWLGEELTKKDRSPLSPLYDGLSFLGLVPPREGGDLVKRVIGVAGDMVASEGAGAPVTVNGVALDEPYLFPGNVPSEFPFKVRVPPGRIWVMGDHRAKSADSRAHISQAPDYGFVPVANVVGRASALVWPLGRATRLPRPATFAAVDGAVVNSASTSPAADGGLPVAR